MKNNLFKSVSLTLVLSTLASCSESWLDPEPLSFYEPNITFSTVEGLEGALTRCRSDMLYYFLGSNGTAVSTELNNCCRMLLAANGSAKNNIL